jgi:hypothetical protein
LVTGTSTSRTWRGGHEPPSHLELHQYTGDPADLVTELAEVATERDYWEALSDEELKVAENRLRRTANRQGMILLKSRRRNFRALDYGTSMLIDASTNAVVASGLQAATA